MRATPAREGTIRASLVMSVVTALDRLDRDTAGLLSQHGLKRSALRDPYASIPLARYVALLESAADVTDGSFGLRLGTCLRPADLGPAGLLFASAASLRRGLEHLGRYLATLQSATQVGLLENGDGAAWTYRIEDQAIWPRAQDSELTLSIMCTLTRSLMGQRWRPLEVHFEHGAPADRKALRAVFRAPLLFDQPRNQIVIAPADLDRPLQPGEAEVTPALLRHAQDILAAQAAADARARSTLRDQVRWALGARVGHAALLVPEVARALGLSVRSLQRGLAAEGTSLRLLLREFRTEFAEQRLLSGSASLAALATALGYSDGTVFWRAFRQWRGMSPTAFRRETKARGVQER